MGPDSPRECRACGEALAPGVSFCRACGTRCEEPKCARCEAPIIPGTAFCRSCGAPLAGASPAAPIPAAAPPRGPAPPPARDRPRRAPILIAATIVLIGAGAAAAIVLAGNDEPGSAASTASAGEQTTESTEPTSSTEAAAAEAADGFPDAGLPEMEEEIESVLYAYHQDVVEGDFPAAWALLSARKRQQNLAEYGYAKWRDAQASLSAYLSPAGLRAGIDALEEDGVARVMVTGMGWSAPGASCGEWSGLTWVRYERGEWTYDPGYSTTGSRRRVWQPRSDELLGARC